MRKAGKGASGPPPRPGGEGGGEEEGAGRPALGSPIPAASSTLPLPSPGHEYVTSLYFPSSIAEAAARHIVLLGLRILRREERATGAVRRGGLRREPRERRAAGGGRGRGRLQSVPPGLSP